MSLKWTSDHEVFEADAAAIAEAHNQAVDIAYAEGIREGRSIRDAERAVIAAAEALEAAHVALNVATNRDTKRNLVAKRDRLTLALFAAVRALREAQKEVKR